jgi:hypothetical protein
VKKLLATLLLIALFPANALAIGEVFKIETSGTEYCGHFDATKFNSSNNIDLWVQIVSENELSVSVTPNFQPEWTFPMFGYFYQTSSSAGAFIGGVLFQDGAFATIQGTAKFDRRTGAVASLSGEFIQSEVFFIGCFSSGKFKSQRVL